MLPTITQLEFTDTELTQTTSTNTVHKTFLWDFSQGDFVIRDGKFVEVSGLDYVKVWIEKALRTKRNTLIYEGLDYGSDHHKLIGTVFDREFTQAELERMIREALLDNDAITGVSNFTFENDGSLLNIAFNVSSIYGSTIASTQVVM